MGWVKEDFLRSDSSAELSGPEGREERSTSWKQRCAWPCSGQEQEDKQTERRSLAGWGEETEESVAGGGRRAGAGLSTRARGPGQRWRPACATWPRQHFAQPAVAAGWGRAGRRPSCPVVLTAGWQCGEWSRRLCMQPALEKADREGRTLGLRSQRQTSVRDGEPGSRAGVGRGSRAWLQTCPNGGAFEHQAGARACSHGRKSPEEARLQAQTREEFPRRLVSR